MAAYVFSGRSLVMISFNFPASGSLPVIFISLIQGKEHYLQAAIVGGIQKQYCDERFLSYNRDKSITFPSILCHQLHVWHNEFLNDKFYSDLFVFLGLLCFISYYSKHLSVIYNNKNYGSLPYIQFIAVQNSSITLDRPQYAQNSRWRRYC